MRHAVIAALLAILTSTVGAQPAPKPANGPKWDRVRHPWPGSGWLPPDDPKMRGAYFKLEVLGWLEIEQEPIDADPKTLQIYSRNTGVGIGSTPGHILQLDFELFLGGTDELVKAAKTLNQKWVIVEGSLAIVHGPMQLSFGDGWEDRGKSEYAHARPRKVIKVWRLAAAPAGVPNEKQEPYIKAEVRGVLRTNGTNPPLGDISAGFATPSTVIQTDQCDINIYLGKSNTWLARAKELQGQAVVARGEFVTVTPNPPNYRPGNVLPNRTHLLDIADLQPAPAEAKKTDQKK